MKNRFFFLAAILALLATACKKENPQNDLAVTPITISASYGVNDDTKVSYTESGDAITATWDASDQLYVVYNGHLNTLTLSSGAGTATATFTGTVVGTPTAMSVLICYVRDTNNPSAVEVSATGEYTYASGVFLAQDGTLASAAKCNLFYGTTTYGNGSNISCTFSPNTSMMKLTVFAPDGVSAGDAATLTYKSGSTELAKATFTVGAYGRNTIYLTVPAGEYTGTQTFVYHSGEANVTDTLSNTQACFAAGQTYSKRVKFGNAIPDGAIDGKFTINASGDQVYFSQGNLQYKTDEGWRFAESQYYYVGSYYTGNWVDMFQYNVWGNPYPVFDWRLPSMDELVYVFNTRTTSSGIRYAKGRIDLGSGQYRNGVILLPDDWDSSVYELNSTNNGSAIYSSNTITATNWSDILELNGAVFLPAVGNVNNGSYYNLNVAGHYWSSSSTNGVMIFRETSLELSQSPSNYHFSVRLVCPAD